MNKQKNPILLFLIGSVVVIAIVIIGSILSDRKAAKDVLAHMEGGDWEIISTEEYVRDGQKCMGYRIYVDAHYGSEDIYKDIFNYVTDDGYYLHIVWIYNVKSMANGNYSADYILEQTRLSEVPNPKRQ